MLQHLLILYAAYYLQNLKQNCKCSLIQYILYLFLIYLQAQHLMLWQGLHLWSNLNLVHILQPNSHYCS